MRYTKTIGSIVLTVLIALVSLKAIAQLSSPNFSIEKSSIAGGGGTSQSPSFSVAAAIGQPMPVGESSSPSFAVVSGNLIIIDQEVLGDCEFSTNYRILKCSGKFQIASMADYQTYVDNDFGRNGRRHYKDLKIVADLSDTEINIVSPCRIEVTDGVRLNAQFVGLDGRKGVIGKNNIEINAAQSCLRSEKNGVKFGANLSVSGGTLTIEALKEAEIGKDANLNVAGDINMGSFKDRVKIKKDATVSTGALNMIGAKAVEIGDNSQLIIAGQLFMESTGSSHPSHRKKDSHKDRDEDDDESEDEDEDRDRDGDRKSNNKVSLEKNVELSAQAVSLISKGTTEVEDNVRISTSGDLIIQSQGSDKHSKAKIDKNTTINVDGDMVLASGNKSEIDKNATISVINNLHMEAGSASKKDCVVKSSAIVYGTKSGNCESFLP